MRISKFNKFLSNIFKKIFILIMIIIKILVMKNFILFSNYFKFLLIFNHNNIIITIFIKIINYILKTSIIYIII